MNIYEDYINYMNEHSEFIEQLYQTNSKVLIVLDDVIKVCDHIYRVNEQNNKVLDEEAQIFEIGFGYLVNSISDLETYYNEYLNKDVILFNQYANILVYSILIEDFKSYLISNDIYDEECKKLIDPMLTEIEDSLAKKKELKEEQMKKYTDIVDALDSNNSFRPAYSVFSLIAEELEIY